MDHVVGTTARTGARRRPTLSPMCLLIVISGVVPGMPLIVAANRDERRARPTIPMTRLDDAADDRAILGGRDEVGGGTWLAINEAGVVVGLTNRPLRDGPDAAKRSRGSSPSCAPGTPVLPPPSMRSAGPSIRGSTTRRGCSSPTGTRRSSST